MLHPDGTRLQRLGVLPDVRAAPTLRGVRAGEDDVLTAALREALALAHADDATVRTAVDAERRREHVAVAAPARPAAPEAAAVASAGAPSLPEAFHLGGSGYEAGRDDAVRHGSDSAVVLRAKDGPSTRTPFGSYAEEIPLDAYRGKRVRVSGYLRCAEAGRAVFWLRIDGPNGAVEGFDNMSDRALSGTRDWTPFAIVLDVPNDAEHLLGGLLLSGGGAVWADDLRIDTVDDRVPATGTT